MKSHARAVVIGGGVVGVSALYHLAKKGWDDVVLIDVRNPSEASVASIAGSHLIPLSTIENGDALEQVRSLAQGKRLLVHCKLGGRSARRSWQGPWRRPWPRRRRRPWQVASNRHGPDD
mgnify:CR=1 FL=1